MPSVIILLMLYLLEESNLFVRAYLYEHMIMDI